MEHSISEVSFLSGLLACMRREALTLKVCVDGHTKDTASWTFAHIERFCRGPHQYHAFQLLLVWFKKVTTTPATTTAAMFQPRSTIARRTVDIIFTHLDSPVDGVNAVVMETTERLLVLSKMEREEMSCDDDERLECEMLNKCLQLSWLVKGKHGLLAVVLNHLDINQVCKKNLMCILHTITSSSSSTLF